MNTCKKRQQATLQNINQHNKKTAKNTERQNYTKDMGKEDASRSKAASPMPDIKKVRSSGYGSVDKKHSKSKHSGGYKLMPPVEN